jgi:hypothetical protein
VPRGTRLAVFVRAGNTEEPDGTWSEWYPVDGREADVPSELPAARWLQIRVDLEGSRDGSSPVLRGLEAFYAPRNRAPFIRELTVQPAGVVWAVVEGQSVRPRGPLVAEDMVSRRRVAEFDGARARPVRKVYEQGARTLTWSAVDPDGDALRSRVELRREGDPFWILLASEVEDDYYGWDARVLPDGLYRARITVSDASANREEDALTDDRISSSFQVDNTRPRVERPSVRRERDHWEVEFVANDPGGNVAAVEVAIGDDVWQPIDPADGVADSAEERYRVHVDPGSAPDAPRSLRVRVTDAAGNLAGEAWPLPPQPE